MTRGRKNSNDEAEREMVETDLAALGTARVILRLIYERVAIASEDGSGRVLVPALDDLCRAERLIRTVQARIAARAGE